MNRIYAIDIEASGFHGYPIELGWCEIGTSDVHSFLIKPTPKWKESLIWDEVSEGIHGITMNELERDGLDPGKVVQMFLDSLGKNPVLFSDARSFDQQWLDLLFGAVGFDAPILRQAPMFPRHEMIVEPDHRAGPDAFALARHLASMK